MAKNMDLPVLPAWHARSFYASLLMAAVIICNAVGLDLWPVLNRLGLGSSADQVLDRVMLLAPLAFGVWAWWERKAPNYRLSLHPNLILERARAFWLRLWSRRSQFWDWLMPEDTDR
ncbi:hypothetical protein E0K93_09495 [Puniceibacterium sp. HSS470]|nr:hypothetical protein E0K93_09495 [Puniceibacterium sp. HSS470]|tara:strand:- start:18733 stop:19083 length:351 start_codon:yes stop_codon:yes gene_type:complete